MGIFKSRVKGEGLGKKRTKSILLFANVPNGVTPSFLNRFQHFAYVWTPYGTGMLEKNIGV